MAQIHQSTKVQVGIFTIPTNHPPKFNLICAIVKNLTLNDIYLNDIWSYNLFVSGVTIIREFNLSHPYILTELTILFFTILKPFFQISLKFTHLTKFVWLYWKFVTQFHQK